MILALNAVLSLFLAAHRIHNMRRKMRVNHDASRHSYRTYARDDVMSWGQFSPGIMIVAIAGQRKQTRGMLLI